MWLVGVTLRHWSTATTGIDLTPKSGHKKGGDRGWCFHEGISLHIWPFLTVSHYLCFLRTHEHQITRHVDSDHHHHHANTRPVRELWQTSARTKVWWRPLMYYIVGWHPEVQRYWRCLKNCYDPTGDKTPEEILYIQHFYVSFLHHALF